MYSAPGHTTVSPDQPRYLLCCGSGYASNSYYVACEICEEWFHGDAYGVSSENISKIIGFSCQIVESEQDLVPPETVDDEA
ncbi:hypothetical protein V6N13_082392 [Hibiscus sabdariffa]